MAAVPCHRSFVEVSAAIALEPLKIVLRTDRFL
jgi:hypothetical protein